MADMIELRAACELVREQVRTNLAEQRSLDQLLGCVLAESIVASGDAPPYDKSLVDGYAVIASDLPSGCARLQVIEHILAGHVPQRTVEPGQASRIMTGGALPEGADAVVMLEQTRGAGDSSESVEIASAPVDVGQNIMRRGAVMSAGRVILPIGQRVRAIEIGLLAEAGRSAALAVRSPRVSLIQTGDELVDAHESLGPGQIRNSNGPMLRAMIRQVGGVPQDLGIVPDQTDSLTAAVRQGLEADVLVVSGGVSQGDRDLVPQILTGAGVKRVFHKVRLRPGKPLWFGVHRREGLTTLVFGLPGNPVSGLVCCRLFVVPTVCQLAGHSPRWDWNPRQVSLSDGLVVKGHRSVFWPGKLDEANKSVEPLEWMGSADPFSLAHSDCLIYFKQGGRSYSPGDKVSVIGLEY